VSLDFLGLGKWETRKAPRGKSESLWSLHIRSFWKILLVLMALSKRLRVRLLVSL
jgi:hypothetical protein